MRRRSPSVPAGVAGSALVALVALVACSGDEEADVPLTPLTSLAPAEARDVPTESAVPTSSPTVAAPTALPPPTTLAPEGSAVAASVPPPVAETDRIDVLVSTNRGPAGASLDPLIDGLEALGDVDVMVVVPNGRQDAVPEQTTTPRGHAVLGIGTTAVQTAEWALAVGSLPELPDYVIVGIEDDHLLRNGTNSVDAMAVYARAGIPGMVVGTSFGSSNFQDPVDAAVGWFADNVATQLSLAAEDGIAGFVAMVVPDCAAAGGIIQGIVTVERADAVDGSPLSGPNCADPVDPASLLTDRDAYLAGFVSIARIPI